MKNTKERRKQKNNSKILKKANKETISKYVKLNK